MPAASRSARRLDANRRSGSIPLIVAARRQSDYRQSDYRQSDDRQKDASVAMIHDVMPHSIADRSRPTAVDVFGVPYPRDVTADDDRLRWDMACLLSAAEVF